LRGNNREAEVAAISNGIKSLAKELMIPVIVLAQLNRDAEKHGGAPQLSDLRESGAIEQDADVVLMLWRKKMSDEELEQAEESKIFPTQLSVRKQRNGPTGDAELLFHKARTRFEDAYGNAGTSAGAEKAREHLNNPGVDFKKRGKKQAMPTEEEFEGYGK
jgi:replicative DNA helicase